MASVTYYAVLPFVRNEEGDLCPDEAVECQSPAAAAARARALAAKGAGAVAFSRTGDPDEGEWAEAVDPGKGPLVKSVAHCIYAESARHTGTDWSRNYVWFPDGRVRRFVPNEVELVQGFPRDWTRPKHFDERQADRIDSLRYHAVGNAVTPPVAEWVGRRLSRVLRARELDTLRSTSKARRAPVPVAAE